MTRAPAHTGGDRAATRGEQAPCPHYPVCVGCPLIGKPYGAQLAIKHDRARRALAAYPALAHLEVPALVGSPRAFGYRNQVKLVARRTQRGVLLGVYRPGTHQVVDISRCPVHEPAINRVLDAVRRAVESADVSVYDERSGRGWLRYVVVRTSHWQRTAQVILVVRARDQACERPLVRRLRVARGIGSVVLNLNAERGNVIFGKTFLPLTKTAALLDRVGDLKLQSHAGAFLQANLGVARRLYAHAVERAAPKADEVAVDLYAGVGALSFNLAARAGRVFGIEASPIAVQDARANIRLNGFHNLRFLAGEVGTVLPELSAQLGRVDLLTLNPPRKGLDDAGRAAVVRCEASRLVYVSCDPQTLARDLDWLARQGYRTETVQPFDMLPQTEHVECVAVLQRVGSSS